MAHLYKTSIWKGSSGQWYCNDIEELSKVSSKWWVPARILGIPLTEFVKILIDEFKVSSISYKIETDVLIFSWDKEADARRYKNWINGIARKANYII